MCRRREAWLWRGQSRGLSLAESCPRVEDGVGGEACHPRCGVQERFARTSTGPAEEASGRVQVCGQVASHLGNQAEKRQRVNLSPRDPGSILATRNRQCWL